MRSNQQHLFSHVPSAQIPRSKFNRTHGYKTTFNAGYLIPFYVDEALPGDTFNVRINAFARLATPIVPFMDNLFMDFHFFAVPNRLLWTNWQKFMGEQEDPGDPTDFLVPIVTAPANYQVGSVADYFGLPLLLPNLTPIALPFRAYNLIWNEWFRDQNLQDSITVDKDDGPDDPANYVLLKRGKRHDYFTSCLPWPQKGDAVEIPLGQTANIVPSGTGVPTFYNTAGTPLDAPLKVGTNLEPVLRNTNTNVTASTLGWADPSLEVDLTAATAVTINTLRQAFQIQKLLERDARGGTRYTEILRAHFGVISPDARLQRPEFLGGGTIPINVNPVASTAATSAVPLPPAQGNLSAFATAAGGGIGFSKSFVEHMTVIGLVSVRADLNYQQGLNRMWSRRSKHDFYWPAFAHLGEQAVLNQEIYFQGVTGEADDEDQGVFGYQERFAEYRYYPSQITGLFRSQVSTNLDFWHLAQHFTTLPTLNATFIQETPPIERVIAVTDEPHFLFDSIISIQAARPMPTYSVPGLIDHF